MNNFDNMFEALQSTFTENSNTQVTQSYEDQVNHITTKVIDERHICYLNTTSNPKTGKAYSFMAWVASYKNPLENIPTMYDFRNTCMTDSNIQTIVQIRGTHNVGFQICAINRDLETGNLVTSVEYEASLAGETEQTNKREWQADKVSTDQIISIVASGKMAELFTGISKNKSI